jgi:hypothetical protein
MDAGTTFLLKEKTLDNHLWVVLSDPKIDPGKVLLVSLTTATALKEQICLLEVGDHPWIRHKTCAYYEYPKVVSLATLYKLKDTGQLDLREPLSPAVLERMREGAALSTRMPLAMAEILIEQGLIEC